MKQTYATPMVHWVELKVEQQMTACKTFGQAVLGAPGAPRNIYTCVDSGLTPPCKDFTIS